MKLLLLLAAFGLASAYVPIRASESSERDIEKNEFNANSGYYPVIQMHGMGDFAKNPLGMLPFKRRISKRLNGTYVTNIQIGKNPIADQLNGFLMNLDDQVEYFLHVIQNDTNLANGFDAVGYSQGNLVIRGYIERYNDPPVHNFVSIHGPMMGVASLPQCNTTAEICDLVDEVLIGHAVYDSFVQEHLAQANYYRDPKKLDTYREKGKFLNDINNEKSNADPQKQYITNLQKVNKIALVKALGDTMVWPNDSEWFGFFKDDSLKEKYDGKDSKGPWETDDWFGLKDMVQQGKVDYLTTTGNHLQFPESFLDQMVDTYFKDPFPGRQ